VHTSSARQHRKLPQAASHLACTTAWATKRDIAGDDTNPFPADSGARILPPRQREKCEYYPLASRLRQVSGNALLHFWLKPLRFGALKPCVKGWGPAARGCALQCDTYLLYEMRHPARWQRRMDTGEHCDGAHQYYTIRWADEPLLPNLPRPENHLDGTSSGGHDHTTTHFRATTRRRSAR
jgi:hypothetical protein